MNKDLCIEYDFKYAITSTISTTCSFVFDEDVLEYDDSIAWSSDEQDIQL